MSAPDIGCGNGAGFVVATFFGALYRSVLGWLAHKQLYIVGIRQRAYGDRHLDKQVIYAVKHQSAWKPLS